MLLAITIYSELILSAKNLVARITQAGNDVALLVQVAVDRGAPATHVGVRVTSQVSGLATSLADSGISWSNSRPLTPDRSCAWQEDDRSQANLATALPIALDHLQWSSATIEVPFVGVVTYQTQSILIATDTAI